MATMRTVRGDITTEQFGRALVHEHVLVDFIGADKTGYHRWDKDAVFAKMLPYLQEVKARNFDSFVDCTPAYIGRDPILLRRLSEAVDLHILTTTGYYKEPYLPPHAFTMTADELADVWTNEAENGIEDTGIYPGFIKIAVNPGSLIPIQQKVVRAAGKTHLRTGLAVVVHTGKGVAAKETLALLMDEGVEPDRYVFVHADSEADRTFFGDIARAGGWVEFDGVGWRPIEFHVELLKWAYEQQIGDRILLSMDHGWYEPDKPDGENIKGFTSLSDELIPAAVKAGIPREWLESLLTTNAQLAFSIRK
ncbi:MAG: phosphotriesterase [Candidatus Poribacteria bacterium]|nr:phosphotriesterase [Candidatus Poribacteria bacterium]